MIYQLMFSRPYLDVQYAFEMKERNTTHFSFGNSNVVMERKVL